MQSTAYQLGDILALANTYVDVKTNNPWNVPDWRDESAYPDVAATSSYQWRWEFSRRDPYYRRFWLIHQSQYLSSHSWGHVQGIWKDAGRIFGLDFLVSPACPYCDFIEVLMQKSKAIRFHDASSPLDDVCSDAINGERFLISIDPTVPAKQIMKSLQEAIEQKAHQREIEAGRKFVYYPERWDVKLFPSYLRVLDAQIWMSKETDRTWGDVAEGLEVADESTVQKRFRAADLWRHKFARVPPI
jgi:hypothetical protein